ncbi:hypothetical protein PVAP13_9NG592580 [Panicum virgatum]|uniref:Uncharacterized protein n=1 Tax=Panicum virgatum TaxID=38727 RepID=A0A8T0MU54_PANVG|nr:hypothetical protein PVAP13_9NG592580 [Panicum virgatum]
MKCNQTLLPVPFAGFALPPPLRSSVHTGGEALAFSLPQSTAPASPRERRLVFFKCPGRFCGLLRRKCGITSETRRREEETRDKGNETRRHGLGSEKRREDEEEASRGYRPRRKVSSLPPSLPPLSGDSSRG